MKVLLLIVGAAFGATVAWMFLPRVEVVEAADYLPVPVVDVECDAWYITENAPGYYWDFGSEMKSSSKADFFTIDDSAERYGRGETAVIPPKEIVVYDRASFYITWWDSDRSGDPEMLQRVGVAVQPKEFCPYR